MKIGIITALIAAGVGFYCMMNRRKRIENKLQAPASKSHHLTDVFAKAKNHSV